MRTASKTIARPAVALDLDQLIEFARAIALELPGQPMSGADLALAAVPVLREARRLIVTGEMLSPRAVVLRVSIDPALAPRLKRLTAAERELVLAVVRLACERWTGNDPLWRVTSR